MVRTSREVALALGGGSARGWSHIGAIKALQEAGLTVSCVAGTSIGALVGAFFAAGRLQWLETFVTEFDWARFLRLLEPAFPTSGLINGQRVQAYIRSQLGQDAIEELSVPFACVAVDLANGQEVVMRSGPVASAVRASISIPGMFTPVGRDGCYLVDGGLVNPLPVNVARELSHGEAVVAVDLNHDVVENRGIREFLESHPDEIGEQGGDGAPAGGEAREGPRLAGRTLSDLLDGTSIGRWLRRGPQPNLYEVLNASLVIVEKEITEARLRTDRPDLLVRPNLGHVRFLEFHRARESIDRGYTATREALTAWGGGDVCGDGARGEGSV